MAKIKTDEIRPGDAVLVEVIVDSVELRSDGTVVLRDAAGLVIYQHVDVEVEGTKASDRKTLPPIPPVAPPGAPPLGTPAPAPAPAPAPTPPPTGGTRG